MPSPSSVRPAGKHRNPALLLLWVFLSLGIYWYFWLYRVYREIRAHSPTATRVTPGAAVGYLFIPLFNIFWFFQIAVDLPRAIRRMQDDHILGEEFLPPRRTTGLLLGGLAFAWLGLLTNPDAYVVGMILYYYSLVSCQLALNAHWQQHATTLTASRPTRGPQEFPELLGVRGPSLHWARILAFVAGVTCIYAVGWVVEVVRNLRYIDSPWEVVRWFALTTLGPLLLAASVVVAFRWLRKDWTASVVGASLYALTTLPWLLTGLGSTNLGRLEQLVRSRLGYLWISTLIHFFYALILLAALAAAVKFLRPRWLAFFTAALAASPLHVIPRSRLFALLEDFSSTFNRLQSYGPYFPQDLIAALVFATAFWGGLKLVERRERPLPG